MGEQGRVCARKSGGESREGGIGAGDIAEDEIGEDGTGSVEGS